MPSPKTQTPVNVNSVGWTTVTAQSNCRMVRVCETDQAATTDYLVTAPTTSDGPKTVPAGKESVIEGVFNIGEVVCNLKTVAGSVNFDILETGQVR